LILIHKNNFAGAKTSHHSAFWQEVETASSPIFRKRGGGHYLVDIIAGVAVAVGERLPSVSASRQAMPAKACRSQGLTPSWFRSA
jgi:hypothetical protein